MQFFNKAPLVVKLCLILGFFWIIHLIAGFLLIKYTPLPATSGKDTTIAGLWHRWDTHYYHELATQGYREKDFSTAQRENWAFFPLFPMVWGLLGSLRLSPDVFMLAGMGISVGSTILALLVLKQLFKRFEWSEKQYWLTVLLFLSFPTSYFLVLPYTEALYLLLSLVTIERLFAKQYAVSALSVGLALLTRSTGLTLIPLVLGYTLYHEWRQKPIIGLLSTLLAQFIVMIAPTLLFFTFLKVQTGNFWAAIDIQKAWNNSGAYPLKAFVGYYNDYGFTIFWEHIFQILLLFVLLAVGVASFIRFWQNHKSTRFLTEQGVLWLLFLSNWLVISSIGNRSSYFRYALVIFPIFLWLPIYLRIPKKIIIWISILFSVIHTLFFAFFIYGLPYYGY